MTWQLPNLHFQASLLTWHHLPNYYLLIFRPPSQLPNATMNSLLMAYPLDQSSSRELQVWDRR